MKDKLKTFFIWLALVALFVIFFQTSGKKAPERHVDFEVFTADVRNTLVREVRIDDGVILVTLLSGERYTTYGYLENDQIVRLSENGVPVLWGPESDTRRKVLRYGIIAVVVIVCVIYFLKKAQGGTVNILSMRKSTARKLEKSSDLRFDDVGGCEAAKAILGDMVDFLKKPERWRKSGVRLPRGILLVGPPGCGKTLLARAVAGESDAAFFYLSASEFVEMFVGVGAARVRDLFEKAAKAAPAIIFIDELDAVGRKRGSGIGAGHDEREQTLNQLLVCMDGFETQDRVVVIAATNRPDILDRALIRPGRFDRRVSVPHLSGADRLAVLQVHTRNKVMQEDVSLEELADETEGFTGADLENLVNEAALLAVRRVREGEADGAVSPEDFENALGLCASRSSLFSRLDALLAESASQVAEPTGRASARLTMQNGERIEGDLVWADAAFISLQLLNGRGGEADGVILSKAQVVKIEALKGTEAAEAEDVIPDPWAGKQPDLM